jgi:hypothetical protein
MQSGGAQDLGEVLQIIVNPLAGPIDPLFQFRFILIFGTGFILTKQFQALSENLEKRRQGYESRNVGCLIRRLWYHPMLVDQIIVDAHGKLWTSFKIVEPNVDLAFVSAELNDMF